MNKPLIKLLRDIEQLWPNQGAGEKAKKFADELEQEKPKQPLEKIGCNCEFCLKYHKEKWEEIMSCGCIYHTHKEPIGHSDLCCSCPNAQKSDNPYSRLEAR